MEEKGGLADGSRVVVHGLQARGDLNGQEGRLVEYDYDQGRWRVRMDDGSGKLLRAVNLKPCAEPMRSSPEPSSNVGAAPVQHAGTGQSDLVPGMRVRVVNLKARSDLNGKEGELREYVEVEERWKVWLEDGFGKMLRRDNLEVLSPPENAGLHAGQKTGVVGDLMPEVGVPNAEPAAETVPADSNAAGSPSFQPGERIRIVGLAARPDLNGLEGTVVQWDDAENRWRVRMTDGSGKALKASNMQLIAVLGEKAPDLEPKQSMLSSTAESPTIATDVSGHLPAASNTHSNAPVEETAPGSVEQTDTPKVDAISCGQRVRAVGLQSRSELNGSEGTVVEYDESQDRWRVRLDNGSGLLLKSANLEVLPELKMQSEQGAFTPGNFIRVLGLKARPELNGQEGTVVDWDESQNRWKVKMSDGTGKMFRAVNMELLPASSVEPAFASGDRVCVVGLHARPEWNGLRGAIVEYDDGEGRWKVRMEDGSGKMLKEQNLQRMKNLTFSSATETNTETKFSPGQRVRAGGLMARPDLNGLEGTLVAWEESEARWKVKMDTGAHLMLKPTNMELASNPQETEEKVESSLSQAEIEASWAAFSVQAPAEKAEGGEAEAKPGHEFMSGQRIQVVGLKSRPDLNESEGTVVQWDEGEARWKVRMADGSGKMLRSCNMKLLPEPVRTSDDASFSPGQQQAETTDTASLSPGQRIRVFGLKAKPELNGLQGTLVQWEEDEGRWKVRMEDGSGKMLKPSNLEQVAHVAEDAPTAVELPSAGDSSFTCGQRVSVFGLVARSDLNGLEGTLLEESDGRWKVHMDDGSGKIFKPSNLKAIPADPEEIPTKAELASSPVDDSSAPRERPASVVAGKDAVYSPGQRIRLVGLPTLLELNGLEGTLVEWEDRVSRWRVCMDDGSNNTFKCENLELLHATAHDQALSSGQRVRVSGLKARFDLNGSEGTLVEFDDAEARWKVRMADGAGKMLKAYNLTVISAESEMVASPAAAQKGVVFSPGQRVRVLGLKVKPEMNGLEGTVVQWDEGEGRWKVRMLDGSGKMFKENNLEPVYSATTASAPSPLAHESGEVAAFAQAAPTSVDDITKKETAPAEDAQPVEAAVSADVAKSSGDALSKQAAPAEEAMANENIFSVNQKVSVVGLKVRPELNGQKGTVVEWDDDQGRWKIRMDDGSGKMFKSSNLEACAADSAAATADSTEAAYQSGQQVRLWGLEDKPELNGLEGTLLEWDAFESQWKVEIADGSHLSLKPSYMVPVITVKGLSLLKPLTDDSTTSATFALNQSAEPTPRDMEGPAGSGNDAFSPGQQVRVLGLKARPDLNGQAGTIVDWDTFESRWKVLMADGTGKMLKPQNMELIPAEAEALPPIESSQPLLATAHANNERTGDTEFKPGETIRVVGLKARPDLNGTQGMIVEWDAGEERWKVLMEDGSGKMLKPSNMEAVMPAAETRADFRPGLQVRITGLQAKPELNGLIGTLVEWDEGEGRWKIRLADGSGKMLKQDNIEVVSEATQPPAAEGVSAAPESIVEEKAAFSPGQQVVAVGLKARPDLNGLEGTLVQWDEAEDRWKVRMADGSGKMFKSQNLIVKSVSILEVGHSPNPDTASVGTSFIAGQEVRVVGLVARPDLNGLTGSIMEWDQTQGRWKVRMTDGTSKMFKPDNLEKAKKGEQEESSRWVSGVSFRPGLRGSVEGDESPTFRAPAAETAPNADDGSLRPGLEVRVTGLQARPDLNGDCGTIVQWDETEGRWKVRMSDGSGKMFRPANLERKSAPTLTATANSVTAAASANQREAPASEADALGPGVEVCVVGLQARPELNGLCGTIVQWDESEGRWKVRMTDGSGKMLRPANLQKIAASLMEAETTATLPTSTADASQSQAEGAAAFGPGVEIRVKGLQARPELNGLHGTIVQWEETEDRWKVRMADGSGKMFRPFNLEIISASAHHAEMAATSSEQLLHASTSAPSQGEASIRPGVEVCIVGLKARPELNGLSGTVVEWDETEGRWKVRMADGSGKMLRSANLMIISASAGEAAYQNTAATSPEPPAHASESEVVGSIASATVASLKKVGYIGSPGNLEDIEIKRAICEILSGLASRGFQVYVGKPNAALSTGAPVKVEDMQTADVQMFDAVIVTPGGPGAGAEAERFNGHAALFTFINSASERGRPEWFSKLSTEATFDLNDMQADPVVEAIIKSSGSFPLASNYGSSADGGASLRPGVEVRIVGLQARQELNGLSGRIVEWDETEGRWKVRLDDGTGKMLKAANLEMICASVGAAGTTSPAQEPPHASEGEPIQNLMSGMDSTESTAAYRPGVQVRVFGLQARPELNGLYGRIVAWEETEGRWKVRMDDGSGKMLRSANLEIVSAGESESTGPAHRLTSELNSADGSGTLRPGVEVEIVGLQARPELNGLCGRIVEWDETEARWKVRMDDGTGKMLKSVNLQANPVQKPMSGLTPADGGEVPSATSANAAEELGPGVEVRICGLQARPDLNGLCGRLVEWDEMEGRWKVRMADGSGKMLRPANLEIISASIVEVTAARLPETTSEDRPAQKSLSQTHSAEGAEALGPGVEVRIVGLHARPELNGLYGKIIEWDETNVRWKVRMDDGSGKMFKSANLERTSESTREAGTKVTAPEAVVDVPAVTSADGLGPGVEVRVVGLHARPELNGLRGTIEKWEEIEGRWRVCMANLTAKMFRPVNLEAVGASTGDAAQSPSSSQPHGGAGAADMLPDAGKLKPGDRVRIEGLQARPELNGLCGTTVEFDMTERRWKVKMDDGTGKMLRAANLEAITSRRAQTPAPATATTGQTEKQALESVIAMLGGAQGGAAAASSPPRADAPAPPPSQGPDAQRQALENVLKMCEAAKETAAQGPDAERQAMMNVLKMCEAAKEAAKEGPDAERQALMNVIAMCEAAKAATGGSSFPNTGMPSGARTFAPGNPMMGQTHQETLAKVLAMLGGAKGASQTAESSSVRIEELPEEGPDVLSPASMGSPSAAMQPPATETAPPQSDGELRPGLPVRIVGLQARPDLNGLSGTLVQWDESEARWKVRMDNGSGKMLRAANLEAIPTAAGTAEAMAPESPSAASAMNTALAEHDGELRPGVEVRVVGLQARPELNGLCGKISQWDETEARWKVRMADGSGKMLRPANLEAISTGTAIPGSSGVDVTFPSAVAQSSINQAPPLQVDSTLRPGVEVRVVGLQARPELNGQSGTLVEWGETESRWKVRMRDGTGKMLRSANLSPVTEESASPSFTKGEGPSAQGPDAERQALQNIIAMCEAGKGGATAAASTSKTEGTSAQGPDAERQALESIIAMCEGGKPTLPKGAAAAAASPSKVEVQTDSKWKGRMQAGLDAVSSKAAEKPKTQDITSGSQVRVIGLKARPELNGSRGSVAEWEESEGRWKVRLEDGTGKMFKTENLEVVTASSSAELTSKLTAALQGCSTADQVLSLCKNRQTKLSVVDVAQAFRELARCPDRGVRRADSRLMDLLGHLRELLKGPAYPSPEELNKLLSALVEFDLQSVPLLEALVTCILPQLSNFGSSDLVRAAASLAELQYEDLQFYDKLASKVTVHCKSLAGDEAVCLLRAFAKLRLRHPDMLNALAVHLIEVLPGMSDMNFSSAAAALATLQALSGRALDAVAAEASQRASRLQLSEIFQVATALAPEGLSQEATLRLLSDAASALITRPEELSLEECASALDAMPWLRPRLSGPLLSKVDEIVQVLQRANLEIDEACILAFREIGVESFGIMGTRCILTEMGVKPWRGPALSLDSSASSSLAPEDSTCRTVRICRTAIVEYRLETEVEGSARGTFTQKDSASSSRQPWLRPALLSLRPHRVDPESCPFFQAMGELCLQAAGEAVTESTTEARDRLRLRGVSGEARLWLSEVPSLSSLLALRHFQILLPEVSLELGMCGEPF